MYMYTEMIELFAYTALHTETTHNLMNVGIIMTIVRRSNGYKAGYVIYNYII